MFNDTITIYNHYYDKLTRLDKWNRKTLTGCMWRQTTTKTVSNGKLEVDDSISITIPYQNGYLPPKQYAKLPNDQMSQYWTLDSNDNLDVVVLGDIKVDLTDDYTLTDLRKDYDVYTVSAVSDNTLVDYLKHWEVTAK